MEPVPTGIFECNSRCKCKQSCSNRVAQHPLRAKLQVFKTEKRGWGIRTLADIPQVILNVPLIFRAISRYISIPFLFQGAFICIYVGNLYTNEEANVQGQNYGDEYFAELDMIEVVERGKEGYESDYDDNDEDYAEAVKRSVRPNRFFNRDLF